MSIASGYTLDLYCNVYEADASATNDEGALCRMHRFTWRTHHAQFTGETWAQCRAQAQYRGWIITPDRAHAYCPHCVREGRVPPEHMPLRRR
jgi:hypothetical protein